ncbi:MAG TPA: hypothetical protein VG944_18900, partial [Fimbriimonas sp.]|nr:hypothetical protein [Fimbriimonas sp.]
LKDLIRTGFAAPGLASSKAFDGMAARLVDAQAPGLTRLVRQMGDTVSSGLQWQERLLEQAGSLYLLLQAHKRSDSLDEATKADMRQAIGWTLKKEELPEESKLLDRWTVLGQVRWTEDRITTQRSWLYGAESQRWAMVLAFSVAGSAFDPNLAPYSSFAGPIAFYPGAYPMRAAIFDVEDTPPGPQPNHTIEECLDQYATALSKNPWIEAVPFALGESTVTPDGDDWSLTQNGKRLPITRGFTPWSFLAQTGGHPCSVFGEWTGRTLRLLSAELNGRPIRI